MNNFSQQQQTEIVGDAMNLTAAIESEKRELQRLKAERFKPLPAAPTRKVINQNVSVKPDYPKVPRASLSFGQFFKEYVGGIINKNKKKFLAIVVAIIALFIILMIIGAVATKGTSNFLLLSAVPYFVFIGAVVLFVITFVQFNKKRNALNRELAQDPEYLKAIKDAEELAAEKQKQEEEKLRAEQAKLDAEYKTAKEHYDNVIVPEYKIEAELWQARQQKKIDVIEADLKVNTETLQQLYDTTKLISATYRTLNILSWLFTDMSTSDHDIRYATELLDRDRQRVATTDIRRSVENMDKNMQQGFNAVYAAIEEGNDIQLDTLATLESTNKLVSKTRRDINIGTVIGTVQRHKTNKTISGN